MNFGSGAALAVQPWGSDLNEHVRNDYGILESQLQIQRMAEGDSLPVTSEAESMGILCRVFCDEQLNIKAASGFQSDRLSLDAHGM